KAILLHSGRLESFGNTENVIHRYRQLTSKSADISKRNWGRGKHTAIRDVRLVTGNNEVTTQYVPGEPLRLNLIVETDGTAGMSLELFLLDANRTKLGLLSTYQFHGQTLPSEKGVYSLALELSPLGLASGAYGIDVATSLVNIEWDHSVE